MVRINYNNNDSHEKVTIIKNNGRIGTCFSNKQKFYCFSLKGIYWRIIHKAFIQNEIQKIFQNFSNSL